MSLFNVLLLEVRSINIDYRKRRSEKNESKQLE